MSNSHGVFSLWQELIVAILTRIHGTVSVSKAAGITRIVLTDGDKNVIQDDVNPSIGCTKPFGTSDSAKSSAQTKSVKKSVNI